MSGSRPRDPSAGRWRQVEALFERALELEASARAAFLGAACGEDVELRSEVEELLEADARAPGFLDSSAAEFAGPAWAETEPTLSDERVGPYRLIEEIGRGGMSRVFRAEREDDRLRRAVALKRLAAPGSSRADVERRFRAEGLALAALSHPNIAQVFDAGVDERGDPYLVIEHVDGPDLIAHCRARALTTDERLRIFLDVCAAVQHAHDRFVVHRDLKPSNILVDPAGRVKLLDFGIAKLLDPALLDKSGGTAPTRTGLLALTPEYAAPEQFRGEEITTATDVYALGLLLYELLADRRPFDLAGRTPAAMERVVSDRDPEPPSGAVAGGPGAERRRARLRGDLDTIVLKALRKAPADRYRSVEALADDLRRHLEGLPVEARPASALYRAGRFVRRHRFGVAVAALFALGALGAGAVLVREQRRTARERDRALLESTKAEQVSAFLFDLFEANDPAVALGGEITARELLRRGTEQVDAIREPAVQARMLDVLGEVQGRLGSFERAEELLRRALEMETAAGRGDGLEAAAIRSHLGAVRLRQSAHAEAEALFREALAARERLLGPSDARVGETLSDLTVAVSEQGRFAEAEPLVRRAIAILAAAGDAAAPALTEAELNLGELLHGAVRYDESEAALRSARERFLELYGPVHPRVADASNTLANLLGRRGRFEEAGALQREALELRRRLFGEDSALVAQSLNDLAVLLENGGDFEAAAPVYAEAMAAYERLLGPDHLAVAIIAINLGGVELLRGRWPEAEALFRRGLRVADANPGAEDRYGARAWIGLAQARLGAGDPPGAEELARRALEVALRVFPDDHPTVAAARLELGRALLGRGRPAEAVELLVAAEEALRAALGEAHPRAARAAAWLGAAEAAGEAPETGVARLRSALAAQRAALPAGHPQLAETEAELTRYGGSS